LYGFVLDIDLDCGLFVLFVGYAIIERFFYHRGLQQLRSLREELKSEFSLDKAHPSIESSNPSSTGHCAAVSIIVHCIFGGDMISVTYENESHCTNEIPIAGNMYEVDLTGDQFGFEPVRVTRNRLFLTDYRRRSFDDIDEETKERAMLLAERAGF
jgi:hypothetical protein